MEQQTPYRIPRSRGPKIAVIGGGHGLSNMLRGLKQYTENISAIVTVADDGNFNRLRWNVILAAMLSRMAPTIRTPFLKQIIT